jgi:hypothetical protein
MLFDEGTVEAPQMFSVEVEKPGFSKKTLLVFQQNDVTCIDAALVIGSSTCGQPQIAAAMAVML